MLGSKKFVLLLVAAALPLAGFCMPPAQALAGLEEDAIKYEARSAERLSGRVAIGTFHYLPYEQGKLKYPDMVETTMPGVMTIDHDIAWRVRKITTEELVHIGVTVDQNAPLILEAAIVDLIKDNRAIPLEWSYTVEYTLRERERPEISYSLRSPALDESTFRSSFERDYEDIINGLILAGFEYFIRDPQARKMIALHSGQSDVAVPTSPDSPVPSPPSETRGFKDDMRQNEEIRRQATEAEDAKIIREGEGYRERKAP